MKKCNENCSEKQYFGYPCFNSIFILYLNCSISNFTLHIKLPKCSWKNSFSLQITGSMILRGDIFSVLAIYFILWDSDCQKYVHFNLQIVSYLFRTLRQWLSLTCPLRFTKTFWACPYLWAFRAVVELLLEFLMNSWRCLLPAKSIIKCCHY